MCPTLCGLIFYIYTPKLHPKIWSCNVSQTSSRVKKPNTTMRAPSIMLKSLSSRWIQPRAATAAVAPLPVTTRFNRELTAELNTLHCGELGLAQLLDASITTQKIALDSLVKICYKDGVVDRLALEEYLENNIEILDACNYFVERIEDMKKYVVTLKVVTHLVGSGSSSMVAIARALELLESCHHGIEKKLKPMGKRCLFPRPVCFCCASTLKLHRVASESSGRQDAKLRVTKHTLCYDENEFSEIVCGSMAMALMGCNFLQLGLSLDSRSGVLKMKKQCHSHPKCSFSWWMLLQEVAEHKRRSGSLVMAELLQHAVIAARELKEQLKGKRVKNEMNIGSVVERVQRSCRELEDGLDSIEGRVKDLYKSLIDVRMLLLGILSHA